MADNTTLNPGVGGDIVRTVDVGSGVKIPVSFIHTGTTTDGGGVTSSNPFPTSVTDGTNGVAAVKAASTAAVATDIAAVVSLSPNSPVKATIKPLFGSSGQALTITLASLASSATAARQSTAIDNSTNLFEDVHLFVKIKTGASGTSATGYVNVYGYATADGGTTYPEGVVGTDGAVTLAAPSNLVLLAQLTANANATTYSAFFSFANNYGLVRLPQKWGVVVANVSGAALDATAGNHAVLYQGLNGQLT